MSLPRHPDDNSQEAQYDRLYQENLQRAREEARSRQELE